MLTCAQICDGKAAFELAGMTTLAARTEDFYTLGVVPLGQHFYLSSSPDGITAHPDISTCQILRTAVGKPGVSLKAVVEVARLREKTRKSADKLIKPITVNIYGPYEEVDQVGRALSTVSAFLQHPFYLETGVKYFNPQLFRLDKRWRI